MDGRMNGIVLDSGGDFVAGLLEAERQPSGSSEEVYCKGTRCVDGHASNRIFSIDVRPNDAPCVT
ncbi:dTDP-4-dehydrorhamnose reductase [Leifsonia xyli subsp. cynodontis DSM 46306]|uniref:Uncharacterized protein n=1 Tax=Leifsonia xyli subsp. cynodontis DSM 46306 TaxID=1389489 RepID=U3P923_LEIXC|nr:dTDP-4-dehydrorhamnose reductase [Leifsonia xyli subsp. cynodontis DSM 46306]